MPVAQAFLAKKWRFTYTRDAAQQFLLQCTIICYTESITVFKTLFEVHIMATEQTAHNPDWFKAQQQYWDTWFQGQRQFFDQQNPAAGLSGQWDAFFREWQNLTTGGATPAADSYRVFFTQAGKSYLDMLEKFCQNGACLTPEETLKSWMDQMQKFYGSLLQQNAQPFDVGAQFKSFAESFTPAGPAFWSDLFKQPTPGQQYPHTSAAFLFDPFGFYASMPGVGYTREKQDSYNQLYRLWVDYEGQMRRYNVEMTKVAIQALQKFQHYVAQPPEGEKPLESLKDIYVKFVDISEEVFAEFALSDDYTKLYGEVVNALMAYKKQLHVIADEVMEQINLPGRTEVDTLHKRVHELRRENIQLKKDIAEIKAALGAKPAKPAAPKAAAVRAPAKAAPKAKPAKPAKSAAKKPAAKKAGKK